MSKIKTDLALFDRCKIKDGDGQNVSHFCDFTQSVIYFSRGVSRPSRRLECGCQKIKKQRRTEAKEKAPQLSSGGLIRKNMSLLRYNCLIVRTCKKEDERVRKFAGNCSKELHSAGRYCPCPRQTETARKQHQCMVRCYLS